MECDMCGKQARFKALVEGSELFVCDQCSKFGKTLGEIRISQIDPKKQKTQSIMAEEKELMEVIVPDYPELIKSKREALGLKQEDFAKKINEKASLIHKIESGHFEPNVELARKLERFLKIKLVEEHEEIHKKEAKKAADSFTLGDFVKIKK
ncbi:MAG: multiprotein bridging factor aMBF1 [Candidatus Woesearchaeota archaeon]|nr:multiprotein bridging factor aMBF1 [Candidatus Woesearchaeota archaeon]